MRISKNNSLDPSFKKREVKSCSLSFGKRGLGRVSVFFIVLLASILFSSCTISQSDRENIQKVVEIRDSLLNKGDIKSLGAFLTSDFPEKNDYLKQLNMQHFYITDYAYRIRMIKPGEAESFGRKSVYRIEYNLTFKMPEDKAPVVFMNRAEKITFAKEDLGWQISNIEEIKDSGTKIDAQTVYDVFFALDTRKAALLAKDSELFETIISKKYKGREKLIDDFKKNHEAFSQITYKLNARDFEDISKDKKIAKIVQFYDLGFKMEGTKELTEIKDQKEIITLEKEDDGWKIVGGLN